MEESRDDAAARVGSIIDQRFRVEKLLGAGGMGAVYVVTATNGANYALKLLLHERLGTNAELVARFVREARLAASVDSPNVVRTYECLVDPATRAPAIVMEMLDGYDAEGLVERVGPVDPKSAVRIVIQAAKGLRAAHSAGIVHRDIKPANIFLHRNGPEITVKVCDFGIAKALVADNESLTVTGTPLGTPLYLSPEQMRSAKHVDARTDVWSLGMTLWTLLAGRSALGDSPTLAELFLSICTRDILWLQEAAPWIPPDLARVVHACLLRDLPMRCPDVDALIRALEPFAGGTDVLREQDLVGVTPDLRATAAPRADRASSWDESVPRADAPDPALAALLGKTLADRYRLERLLGVGGMGAVYEAMSATGERVAVKVVLGDPDRQRPDMLRRFVREARATMAIDSPNVVRVVDADADAQRGFPFIVMELLSGTDLDRNIRASGALMPGAAVRLFLQACAGLGAAHARGILHRDVKPANVFLHQLGSGAIVVKICDFGIAKQVHDGDSGLASTELTRTGGVLGSPMYMSPEQARSAKHVDSTTDVWSLGAALYEALSGRRVWEGHSSVGDLIVAICTKEVPPLQEVAPWIEPGLAEAVHKALQREPSARHATMEAFAAALAPYASREPLTTSALVPVPEQLRSHVAARSPSLSGSTSMAAASLAPREPSKPRRAAFVAVAAVLAVGGVAAFILRAGNETKPTAPAASAPIETPKTSAPATSQEATSKTRVTVAFAPRECEVLVDGKPATDVHEGVLGLTGVPGDSFQVTIKLGTRSESKQVFIAKDGKASIDRVELPAEKAKAVAPKPATSTTTPTKTSVAITAAPTPTPTTPPPATTPVGASTF